MRSSQKALELIRVLRAFILPRLTTEFFLNFVWVLNNVDGKFTSEWRQEGYTFEGANGKPGAFTDTSGLKRLKRADHEKYYAYKNYGNDSGLPDNLETSLDKIFSLSQNDWAKFYLASTWLYQASAVWGDSQSLSFMAYTNAIEALINKTDPERCKECGQEMHKVTKKFSNFLKTYVPDIASFKEEKELIYKTRSKITHGEQLLESDLYPWRFMSKKAEKEGELHRNLNYITHRALRNWLSRR